MRRRPGFTLLEMLVVLVVFTLLVGVCAVLVMALIDTHAADARSLERTASLGRLADQFRADVAAADATPEKAGEFTAGPTCLILRRAAGDVVYRVVEGELIRFEPSRPKAREAFPLGGESATVEFRHDEKGRTVTLRWADTVGPARAPVRQAYDIAAVLGGDLR